MPADVSGRRKNARMPRRHDFSEHHTKTLDDYYLGIRGTRLRHAALAVLLKVGSCSIDEMWTCLKGRHRLDPSVTKKSVADALRYECAKGRATRIGYGVYRIGELAPRTQRRIEHEEREIGPELTRGELEAHLLGEEERRLLERGDLAVQRTFPEVRHRLSMLDSAIVVATIGLDERRARLGALHHLATPAQRVEDVAAALVGLHSSDPVTVYLSCWARIRAFERRDLERALYDDHSLIRMLGMRRTMFVVPVADAPVLDAACTKALAARERRRLIALIEGQGVARDGAAWVRRVERKTLAALEAGGEATAAQLTSVVPELAGKLLFGEGKKWAGTMGLSTRVLFLLATDAKIVRGRPLGTWVSTQYRWTPIERWLGAPLPVIHAPEARAELVRRWLHTYGPGTLTDIKWWTGWSAAMTRAALHAVDAREVRLDDGAAAYVLDDVRPARAKRWVAFLPGLDPTVMGWKERAWFLGDHQQALFDRNGNAGPTVWCNGRIVGGWTQRRDGTIAIELLEKVDSWASDKIAVDARRLASWLGDTRITPRFRTPLEQRL